jgi:hypothetical protein
MKEVPVETGRLKVLLITASVAAVLLTMVVVVLDSFVDDAGA